MSKAQRAANTTDGKVTTSHLGGSTSERVVRFNRVAPFAIFAAITLPMAAMLWWTWLKWADVLVDFGRELYTPWQITRGHVLYRDIAAFYGPLSQHFNALVLSVGGVSLRTLVVTNVAITVGVVWLLYQLLRAVSSRLAATVACVVFVVLFAAAQHLPGIVNYNYVNPYSHEALHGLALSLLAMYLLSRYQRRATWWWAGAAGFALGLVLLTKPESFIAAGPAVVGGLVLSMWCLAVPARTARITIVAFVVSMSVPFIIAWCLLSTAMPAGAALRGVLGSWPYLLDDRVTSLPFFKINMGADDVPKNITQLLVMGGWWLLAIGPAILIGLSIGGHGRALRMIAAIGAAAVPAVLWVLTLHSSAWANCARPLPVIMLAAWVITLVGLLRCHGDKITLQLDRVLRLSLITFAGLLLLKMALFTRLAHYGFVLAMPATLLTVVLLVDWLPRWVDQRGGSGMVVRIAALVTLAMVVHVHVRRMNQWLNLRKFDLANGADAMVVDEFRGAAVAALIDHLSQTSQPGNTLVVLPEGVMLNYLLRMDNPTPYITFLPSDMMMFGEQPMLDALRQNPPDYIAMVHRLTPEYGKRVFGQDYGADLMQWVTGNYTLDRQFGELPTADRPSFFVLLLRRNP